MCISLNVRKTFPLLFPPNGFQKVPPAVYNLEQNPKSGVTFYIGENYLVHIVAYKKDTWHQDEAGRSGIEDLEEDSSLEYPINDLWLD